MKQNILFMGLVVLLFSCSKDSDPNNPQLPENTRLSVSVIDTSGNPVEGARVNLLVCGTPSVPSRITNNLGNVVFDTIPYPGLCTIMPAAEKGFSNNSNHLNAISIISGQLNQFTAVIYETGTLKLQINDCETYNLTSNIYTGPISGCHTYHFFPDSGPLAFRSALATSPGDYKDTVVQITTGDTTTLILPY